MSTTTSPLRPPSPRRSPTASQSSPSPRASASTASAPPPRTDAPSRSSDASSAATPSALSFSACSFCKSSCSATICSRIAPSCCSWRSAASRAARRCAALKSASGFDPSALENCAQQILAHARRLLGHHGLQPVLHGGGGLVPEQARELARQHPGLGPEHLVDLRAEELRDHARLVGERRLDLARDLLELVAHELRVQPRLLALQHARADLDRVVDHAHRVLAGLQPRAHEGGRRRIVDDEALHEHAPHEHVDPLLA